MGFTKRRIFFIGCLLITFVTFSVLQFLSSNASEPAWFKFKLLWSGKMSYLINSSTLVNSPIPSLNFRLTTSDSTSLQPLNFTTSTSRPISLETNKFVLTYEEYGQLGNAMFQYAGTIGMAYMNDMIPLAYPGTQLRDAFKISHVMGPDIYNNWNVVSESTYGRYESKFEHLPLGNVRLQAYFQSYKYFEKCNEEVKKEFTFLDHIQAEARAMLVTVTKNFGDRKLVGVHVRRGDKLLFKDRSQGEQVAPESYFQKAFKWMREHHGNVLFLVTSDDIDWCKNTFQQESDVTLLPFAPREVHMCLLSLCHHVIMSVGTFGWWAGWLSGGDVIYYKHQIRDGSPRSHLFNVSDFVPPTWIVAVVMVKRDVTGVSSSSRSKSSLSETTALCVAGRGTLAALWFSKNQRG